MTPEQAEVWNLWRGGGGTLSPAEIQEKLGLTHRQVKSRLDRAKKHAALGEEGTRLVEEAGANVEHTRRVWFKNENVSVLVDIPPDEVEGLDEKLEAHIERCAKYAPEFAPINYDLGEGLLVICPADVHTGKLARAYETGDEYNIGIAEQRTREGVQKLLDMGTSFGIEEIIVNTGNDGIHVDNSRRTTTSGTPQDTDGQYWDMCESMFWTWVWVIEQARLVAPVRVVFDPSNHPWLSDWHVNQRLAAWFRSTPGVTFTQHMQSPIHRKYVVYGNSIIGFTHGDGAKDNDIAMLANLECRDHLKGVSRIYVIVKHLHHKVRKTVGLSPALSEKDLPGVTIIRTGVENLKENVCVEVVRSPSGTDSWHHRNGYVGAMKAVEAYFFHPDHGQLARFTWPFW